MAKTNRWIEMSHGTVCRHCLLWPDRCTCDPKHPLWQVLRAVNQRLEFAGTPQSAATPQINQQ